MFRGCWDFHAWLSSSVSSTDGSSRNLKVVLENLFFQLKLIDCLFVLVCRRAGTSVMLGIFSDASREILTRYVSTQHYCLSFCSCSAVLALKALVTPSHCLLHWSPFSCFAEFWFLLTLLQSAAPHSPDTLASLDTNKMMIAMMMIMMQACCPCSFPRLHRNLKHYSNYYNNYSEHFHCTFLWEWNLIIQRFWTRQIICSTCIQARPYF